MMSSSICFFLHLDVPGVSLATVTYNVRQWEDFTEKLEELVLS